MANAYDEQYNVPALEVELAGILHSANLHGRQARAVAARLGWDGQGGCTLALAAKSEGYSRERVRQLEERVRSSPDRSLPHAFAVEAALRLIESAAPIDLRDASVLLAERGVSRCPFQVEGLLSAADIVDAEHSLRIRDGMVVRWGLSHADREPAAASGEAHLHILVESMVRAGHSERSVVTAVEEATGDRGRQPGTGD